MNINTIKQINKITAQLQTKINKQLQLQKQLIKIKKEVEELQSKLNKLTTTN